MFKLLSFDLPANKVAKAPSLMEQAESLETWKALQKKHESEAKAATDPELKKLHQEMAANAEKSVALLQKSLKRK